MNDKVATTSYAASGLAAWFGALDWNTISMVGGLVFAAATFGVNWWYKSRDSKAFREAILKGAPLNEPKD